MIIARRLPKRRRSPRRPGPTIAQFANKVGTSEPIMRGLVASGQVLAVDCNGVKIIPPAGAAQFYALFGTPEPSGDAA